MVDAAPAVDTRALCSEVGLVVSKVRSRRELEALDLPCTDELASRAGTSREQLISRSIQLVPEEPYRQFLELLLPFPLPTTGKWAALGRRHISDDETGRGVSAGYRVFGISSWDGLNAKTDELGGRSRREIAEELLATAMLDGTVPTPITTPDDIGRIPEEQPATPRRRRGIVVGAAAALVALALVVGAGVLVLSRDPKPADRGATDVASVTEMAPTCGAVAEIGDVAAPWTVASAKVAIEAAAAEVDPAVGEICAVAPAASWDELVVQEIDDPDSPLASALIGSPDGSAAYLPSAIYAGYRQIGGKESGKAQGLAGYPVAVEEWPDGHVEVTFSKGLVLVGEALHAPFFWIGPTFVDWWRNHAELGLPMSNPMADLSQDLQFGRARLDLTASGGEPVAEVINAREDALPDQRRERILRHSDSTAWWVDADDHRHWIPDGATWECLGGDAVAAGDNVPGWAIATLPIGDLATCP